MTLVVDDDEGNKIPISPVATENILRMAGLAGVSLDSANTPVPANKGRTKATESDNEEEDVPSAKRVREASPEPAIPEAATSEPSPASLGLRDARDPPRGVYRLSTDHLRAIADHVTSLKDLASLAHTCRDLYVPLEPKLYERGAVENPRAMVDKARAGNAGAVEAFLKNGANPNFEVHDNGLCGGKVIYRCEPCGNESALLIPSRYTALMGAIGSGSLDMATALLDHGARTDMVIKLVAYCIAGVWKDVWANRVQLKGDSVLSIGTAWAEFDPLHLAIYSNKCDIVKLFVERGAELTSDVWPSDASELSTSLLKAANFRTSCPNAADLRTPWPTGMNRLGFT